MSETEQIKRKVIGMAATELEEFLNIIGDLTHTGYKISMCKLRGFSYQQCANKLGITKAAAQRYFEKCIEKGYDITLRRLFNIP